MKEIEIKTPKNPCVYLLKDIKDVVVYIGVSKEKLFTRISAHVYDKDFEKVFFIECNGIEKAEILESKLIIEHKPKYNKCLTNPKNIGYIGQSEIINKGKELGYKKGQILIKINEETDKIQIGKYTYCKENIIEKLV